MRTIVYKDDTVIEVLARSSKDGAYGQNTLNVPLRVFRLARLIFTGQASHLDMICP